MQYFGGKARISKPLSEFLNSELKRNQPFVDLFCGSCNVVSKIDSNRIRIANDIHPELMALHRAVQNGIELPDDISEEDYKFIKHNECEPWLKAFAGFGCSFAGKYFGGYARHKREGFTGLRQNYFSSFTHHAKVGLLKKHSRMADVQFTCGSFERLTLPENSLVYCDIPYKGGTGFSMGVFDHNRFYSWVQSTAKQGHNILISEYKNNVPAGYQVLWELKTIKKIRDRNGIADRTVEIICTTHE